jgi:hypothetical protein
MNVPTAIISRSTTGVPSNYQLPSQIQTSPPGFIPTMIPNCTLWLDATDTTSSSLNLSGTSVLNWYDKSGNNNTATAGSVKPILNSSAINGRPAISFTSTQVTATSSYFTGSFSSTFTGSFLQAFVVGTMSSTSAPNGRLFSLARPGVADVANGTTTFPFCRNNGQNVMIGRNSSFLSINIPAYDTPFIGQSSQQNGTQFIGLNGTLTPSSGATANSGSFNISTYGVGTNADSADTFGFHTGFIGEVIYYTAQLTTAQIQQVEGYLAWKWGLTTTIPSNHPYVSVNQLAPSLPSLPVVVRTSITNRTWQPNQFPNMAVWFDAADSSTITVASGTNNVNSINDKSGNNRTATLLTSLGTVTYNSVAKALVFSGSGALNSPLSFGSTSPLTCFAVINTSALGAFRAALSINSRNVTRPNMLNIYQSDANYIFFSGGTPLTDGTTTTTVMALNTGYIFAAYWAPNLTQVNVNGTSFAASTNAPPSLTNSATFLLGCTVSSGVTLTEYWSGSIFEVILFNATLPQAQREQMEGYLAWKWGLQGNLPVNHPFKYFPPPPP